VVAYLIDNFTALTNVEWDSEHNEGNVVDLMVNEFPGLLEEILHERMKLFPLPPPQVLINRQRERKVEEKLHQRRFPWVAILIGIIGLAAYPAVSNMITIGGVGPYVNITFILFVAYIFLFYHT
jgi:hypothetical protein